jgi:hypothetical protein
MLNEKLIWVSQLMPLRGAAGESCANSVGPPTRRQALIRRRRSGSFSRTFSA